MKGYTPNTESVREGLIALARSDAARHGDVDLDVVASEVAGQFDRWLASVERAAAEKALTDAAEATEEEAPGEPHAGATFVAHAAWLRARAAELLKGQGGQNNE